MRRTTGKARMTKVPSLNYDKLIAALRLDGWVVVRQRGSHIRLQKHTRTETLKLTVPAHRPISAQDDRRYPISGRV